MAAKRTGRPKKEINKSVFENACGLQCTLEEIAHLCSCSADTIERWCKQEYGMTFAEVYKKHAVAGKVSLRRTQFKLAERSATMAIFLGKQYLGQRDVIENHNDISGNINLGINDEKVIIYVPDDGRNPKVKKNGDKTASG